MALFLHAQVILFANIMSQRKLSYFMVFKNHIWIPLFMQNTTGWLI